MCYSRWVNVLYLHVVHVHVPSAARVGTRRGIVDRVKYKQSIEFLTNSKNEVPLSEA